MRRQTALLALVWAFGLSTQALGDVYKCQNNGQTTYSDRPCPDQQQRKPVISESKPSRYGGSNKGKQRIPLEEKASEEQIQACLAIFKPLLRDPRGAYADGGQLQRVKNLERPDIPEWREVVVSGHATNGFGGYVGKSFNCILDDKGNVDATQSKVYTALFTLGVDPD